MRLTNKERITAMLKEEKRTTSEILTAVRSAQARVKSDIRKAALSKKSTKDGRYREKLYGQIEQHYHELARSIDKALKATGRGAVKEAQQVVAESLASKGKLAIHFDVGRVDEYFKMISGRTSANFAATYTSNMSSSAVRSLRTAFVEVFRRGAVENMSDGEMQRALLKRWDELCGDDDEFRFVDRAGRKWSNEAYVRMLTRTTTQRLSIESFIDTMTLNGRYLARISNGNADSCQKCKDWEGKIIRISGNEKDFPTYQDARDYGVFHPNCIHLLEYVDEELEAADIEAQRKKRK